VNGYELFLIITKHDRKYYIAWGASACCT